MSCVLCDRNSGVKPSDLTQQGTYIFHCTTCGRYEVDDADLAWKVFEDHKIRPLRYRLSALAKGTRQNPFVINRKVRIDLLAGLPRDKTVQEKIELMFHWFASRSSEVGTHVETQWNDDYPAAWCKSPGEWGTLLRYANDVGLLNVETLDSPQSIVESTVKGWQWLDERPKATGSKAFIAMAFDPSLDDVKAAIHKAIENAGYDPLRVDDDHYSGGVMDRIITHIRDSKFIVADFTKNRGGVYYEAGVAFGLGIDVVTSAMPRASPMDQPIVFISTCDTSSSSPGTRRTWQSSPRSCVPISSRSTDADRGPRRKRSIRWRSRRQTYLSAVAIEMMLVSSIMVVVSAVVARATAIVTRGEKRSSHDDCPDSCGACIRASPWSALQASLGRSRRCHLFYLFTNEPRTRVVHATGEISTRLPLRRSSRPSLSRHRVPGFRCPASPARSAAVLESREAHPACRVPAEVTLAARLASSAPARTRASEPEVTHPKSLSLISSS
jgi:hypothetical protein